MDVGNYSLKSRLLPSLVLAKYSLYNRAHRTNMVRDYQSRFWNRGGPNNCFRTTL